MRYWLFKSEPTSFSFDDLLAAPGQTTGWDGVRNYQARNFLRDDVARGDLVFFFHSNTAPPFIAGIAEVVRDAHPDPTSFDPDSNHHDPSSSPNDPTWYQVEIRAVRRVDPPIPTSRLKPIPELAKMELLRRGSRLSIQPVRKLEWIAIMRLVEGAAASKSAHPKTSRKGRA